MSESLTEHDSIPVLTSPTNGKHLLQRTRELDYFLEMTLDETRVMTKCRTANLFYFNNDCMLTSFYEDEVANESRIISQYCLDNRTSINLRKGDTLKIHNVNGETQTLTVGLPTLCTYLATPEGDIGAIYLRNPIYFEKFFDSDSGLIESLAVAFGILLKNGWNHQTRTELYFNFRSGLMLLLENSHLHQKIKESDNQLKSVLEVSNLINSSRELNEMIQSVLYSARKVIRAESASVFLIDEETGELYFDLVSGHKEGELTGIRIPPGKGIVGKSAQEKKIIMVNDTQNDPHFYGTVDKISQHQTRNLLAAPLLVDGEAIGVVEVLNTIDRPSFTEHDMDIFKSFSDSVAIAMQRRMLLDDIQEKNKQLEKKLSEVTSLHAVAATLVEVKSIDELFTRVLRIIIEDLKVGRASILMYNPKLETLEVVAREGIYDEEAINESIKELQQSKLSHHVFLTNTFLYTNNIHDSDELKKFSSPDRYKTGSSIILPISSSRKSLPYGVLCVSEPESGSFLEEDFRLLNTIVSQMVRGYENFKLNEEILARQAFEKEVEITSRIQQNILPGHIPDHTYMDMGARSVMARTIGGDFYDFYLQSESGDASMLVADVSGKSLPAALFMALSSSILRTIIRSETEPTRILSLANELLYEESHSGMFVTVFLARYEPGQSLLRYASAGHNEMLLVHSDGSYDLLSGKGAPLGVIPNHKQRFIGGEVRVQKGDLLVLYTDGVVEAVNQNNEEYGLDTFVSIIKENINNTPGEIIDAVYDSVLKFSGEKPQYDDFTMMISRFHTVEHKTGVYHLTLPAIVESIPILRDYITRLCINHGIDGQLRDDILLAADEAATNITMHAYEGIDIENPSFECDINIKYGSHFIIQFIDNGKFFNIDEVQHPDVQKNLSGKRKGGFGVYLIRALMDKCEYERKNNRNYFTAEKSLD